jgi:protein disulfide-isomerase
MKTLEKSVGRGKFKSKPTLIKTTDGDSCGIDGCK